MKTEFEALRLDDQNGYNVDVNGEKETLKLYRGEALIAKRIKHKKSIRYFGCKDYRSYMPIV